MVDALTEARMRAEEADTAYLEVDEQEPAAPARPPRPARRTGRRPGGEPDRG